MTSKKDDYLMDRSFAASARLNLQHFYWLSVFDNALLHQAIPVAEQGLKVADVGTGTGIWLLDFARQYPNSAELHGLDISLNQVPNKEGLPSNISFHLYDVYDEPPDDLVEKYDIINVRHLMLVIKQDDPTVVIHNLLKMLKPGGYLQWGEFDLRSSVTVTNQPDSSTVELEGLQHRMADFFHTPVLSWPGKLSMIFEKVGLQNISFEGRWPERSYLSLYMDVALVAYEERINMIAAQQRATQEEVDELRTRLAKAAAESRRGAAWNTKRIVAVGQKPA